MSPLHELDVRVQFAFAIAYATLEYWLGKTNLVKSGSVIELLMSAFGSQQKQVVSEPTHAILSVPMSVLVQVKQEIPVKQIASFPLGSSASITLSVVGATLVLAAQTKLGDGSAQLQASYPLNEALDPIKSLFVTKLEALIPGTWDKALIDAAWADALTYVTDPDSAPVAAPVSAPVQG